MLPTSHLDGTLIRNKCPSTAPQQLVIASAKLTLVNPSIKVFALVAADGNHIFDSSHWTMALKVFQATL